MLSSYKVFTENCSIEMEKKILKNSSSQESMAAHSPRVGYGLVLSHFFFFFETVCKPVLLPTKFNCS